MNMPEDTMTGIKRIGFAVSVFALTISGAWAGEGARPFQLFNRLRVEWDDNIYQHEDDKTSSFKILEEVEFQLNLSLEQSFVGLRYRPQFVWWEKRDSDKTDLQHDLDLIVNHEFNPRSSLSLKDTLRRGELPELEDDGVIVRENDDFYYNIATLVYAYKLRPKTILEASGRNTLMRYDSDEVSDTEDYNIWAGGLTLRQMLANQTTVLGTFRYEDVAYDGPDRDSDSLYLGGGLEKTFSPNLVGNVRAGYQRKSYDSSTIEDETQDSPYGDLSLTFLPSPATRITAGASYSLFESSVFPFASQERTQAYLSFANDLTARISWYLSGVFTHGYYETKYAVEPDVFDTADGSERYYQGSARVSYRLTRKNWLEAEWQYVRLTTDFRMPYTENRLSLGWKTQL